MEKSLSSKKYLGEKRYSTLIFLAEAVWAPDDV